MNIISQRRARCFYKLCFYKRSYRLGGQFLFLYCWGMFQLYASFYQKSVFDFRVEANNSSFGAFWEGSSLILMTLVRKRGGSGGRWWPWLICWSRGHKLSRRMQFSSVRIGSTKSVLRVRIKKMLNTFVTFMISQPGLISPSCFEPYRELLSVLTEHEQPWAFIKQWPLNLIINLFPILEHILIKRITL